MVRPVAAASGNDKQSADGAGCVAVSDRSPIMYNPSRLAQRSSHHFCPPIHFRWCANNPFDDCTEAFNFGGPQHRAAGITRAVAVAGAGIAAGRGGRG
jgi:hypothetical protein